ncbi:MULTISPECIES: spermidine/putrescine ABC transporter permease PotB [Vibrio]|jgi:spermidine/putrescine transport system permease protein|uniref:Spermidine/putrescine transport system permease protein PotB n=1 Tax=Vibrio natriegens NBRC 15636 = ATCC 14048 = DSM 759 TaxID=1219067 RepID=A0AAN0Y2R0_VIBNA|nr:MULTISPECIES: spermidine/putrescine ABC transporter permease PotB [Vibrio]MEE3877921.1 spermidine/putrescine ABC transporter permease PotB [Vibrio sp. YYF0003]CAH0530648.1 Spermidine/putrescine transport system permease protein PotB [Catenococcus thiocycli]AEX21950.1 spermidine/putrescine ABC transporter membrane protein [Vibrio sp. EJY3]ALR15516.1 spermidine/putrescine ABC transporter permease [Vibrio natriegens NBRC 15636 = ATCC 14048 = DSM 759]ANQ12624.1 spermidine/putrescine ABC transpo
MITKKINLQNAIITLIVGWLTLFVLVPNLMIIGTSFLTRDEANLIELTFTLDNYVRLLDPLYAKVLMHSFYMAIIATLLCLVIGYPFAYIVAKMPEKWRPFMLFLVIVPFWTNSLIRTYGLKIVLGTQGILNKSLMAMEIIDKPLRLMYTETAVMIGLVYILLPFMILPLYSAIEKLDNTYIEAAKDLGANKFQTITKVILPLTMPGIIGGCLLVLLPALGMFYISDLLGGAKNLLIGNVIKSQVLNARDWPFGAATSIALTIAMAIMLYAYYRAGKLLNKKVELD